MANESETTLIELIKPFLPIRGSEYIFSILIFICAGGLLDDEADAVLVFCPLLGQALPGSLVGYFYVVGDELLCHVCDGLGHLLELLLGEAGHDLGAVDPLHPSAETVAQGAEGDAHNTHQLEAVLLSGVH